MLKKAANELFSEGLGEAARAYCKERMNSATEDRARVEAELVSAQQKLGKLDRKEQEHQALIDFKTNQPEAYAEIRSLIRNLPHEKKRLLIQRMLRDDRIVITPSFHEDAEGKITLPRLHRGKSYLRFDLSDIEANWRFNLPTLQEILQEALSTDTNEEKGPEGGDTGGVPGGTASGNKQPNPVNAGGGNG